MPVVDKPLEELKKYTGVNPKPADFDEFWNNALKELDALSEHGDYGVCFKPYPLSSKICDAYELTFTSTKEAKIYAKFMKPKKVEGKIPALLIFHGLSGDSGDWTNLIKYASQGYAVAALDTRGQGGKSADVGGGPASNHGTTYTTPFIRGIDGLSPSDMLGVDLFLDTALLAKIVMRLDYVDETRVGVMGGSQGGALSVACAALVPEIKLCAPNYPYMSDYRRVWDMDLDSGAYEGIRYYLRHFDPRHEHIEEFFTKLGYIDIQNLAPRIKAKVLWGIGLMDTTCPPSTQFAAYNKITSEKRMVIYPDYGHENLKGHEEIVFNFLAEL